MQFGFLTPTWVSRLQEVQRAIRLMIESAIREYLIEGKHIERSCTKEINDSSMKGANAKLEKKETLRTSKNRNPQRPHKLQQFKNAQRQWSKKTEQKCMVLHSAKNENDNRAKLK